ncbi:sphingosine hydroxylase [Coccidioides posadasii str. Silveira]|uniref:Sphingosine hydroxylase n=1 Tax=Coccidioides posadasii (strain RMSCC 757 / Silveira) TaxID=443226 RepID=E9CX15_COCPS|nr:sphingosine hydroxylase [Coccidioides posadasii str. Silveira]
MKGCSRRMSRFDHVALLALVTAESSPDIRASSLIPFISDKILIVVLPVAVYWFFSLIFQACDDNGWLSKYKLHTPEEFLKRNRIRKRDVIQGVLIQHVLQVVVGIGLAYFEPDEIVNEQQNIVTWVQRIQLGKEYLPSLFAITGIDLLSLAEKVNLPAQCASAVGFAGWQVAVAKTIYYVLIPAFQYALAAFFVDSWQYGIHWCMHKNRWLYRTFHYRHHQLYVPYAFGALYNHPLEGFVQDTIGSLLAFRVAQLSIRQGIYFFTFATLKTVDDHSGFLLPWDPLQLFTDNNALYHDIHHQSWGMKTNFSQPFFSFWDRVFGTIWKGSDTGIRYERGRQLAKQAHVLEIEGVANGSSE